MELPIWPNLSSRITNPETMLWCNKVKKFASLDKLLEVDRDKEEYTFDNCTDK
jgi:hypothetical protein